MYRKILSCMLSLFLCLACLCDASVTAAERALPEEELYAKSAVLMDADSGRILYEKNGHEALANASTTKILTCILALELCDADDVVEVTSYAASQPKVHLGMREGQTFRLRDLLYGLMLESFNDCAVAIAEFVAGDVRAFAELMNRKAEEIGCEDSHFVTPNGLDGEDAEGFHHTTAADLARIMRYCIKTSEKAEEFLEITRTVQHSFTDMEGSSSYSCVNHNAFLQMMEGALSGKTGFTGNAGYCYVGALERDGRTYIVALLACGWPNNKGYKWSDTKKLMRYGLENYAKAGVEETELDAAQFQPVPVLEGQGDRIGQQALVPLTVCGYEGCEELLLAEDEEIQIRYEIAKTLYAPVDKGDYIGRVVYLLGGEELGTRSVVAGNTVQRIDLLWCAKKVLRLFWL